jgi:hypothetical protein
MLNLPRPAAEISWHPRPALATGPCRTHTGRGSNPRANSRPAHAPGWFSLPFNLPLWYEGSGRGREDAGRPTANRFTDGRGV